MKNYQLIDHTADFGLHVFGTDVTALFVNAAMAMFDQVVESGKKSGKKKYGVRISGGNWQDLMVNWLRELLFLWSARQMLVKKIDILSINKNGLKAAIEYDLFQPDRHVLKNEIKAVTYHQIMVKENSKVWEAKIIFDV